MGKALAVLTAALREGSFYKRFGSKHYEFCEGIEWKNIRSSRYNAINSMPAGRAFSSVPVDLNSNNILGAEFDVFLNLQKGSGFVRAIPFRPRDFRENIKPRRILRKSQFVSRPVSSGDKMGKRGQLLGPLV
jgi:hypothetical protein